jgi:hypothetical protein
MRKKAAQLKINIQIGGLKCWMFPVYFTTKASKNGLRNTPLKNSKEKKKNIVSSFVEINSNP